MNDTLGDVIMSEAEPASDASSKPAAPPPEATTKPKVAKPKSEVAFPYYSLVKSVEAARVVHEKAGGRCTKAQLASLLSYSGVQNGGFLTRLSAARMFGLLEVFNDTVSLTDRARKLLSPVRASDAEQALLEAFMAVDLYRRVFEAFDGQTLPTGEGLKNLLLHEYKVVPAQVSTALRVLMESADTAGLFRMAGNRSRMLKPILATTGEGEVPASPPPAPPPTEQHHHSPRERRRGSEDLSDVHPALAGLLRNLPPVGDRLAPKRRAALIEAFRSTINFLYPEDEEDLA
jgi:hypothetical protein